MPPQIYHTRFTSPAAMPPVFHVTTLHQSHPWTAPTQALALHTQAQSATQSATPR